MYRFLLTLADQPICTAPASSALSASYSLPTESIRNPEVPMTIAPPSLPPPIRSLTRPPVTRPKPHETVRADVHCAACWYSLMGLPYLGRCPECGTRYNAKRNIHRDDRAASTKARRKRCLRPITHVSIIAPIDALRALSLTLLLLTTTGAAAFVIWFIS